MEHAVDEGGGDRAVVLIRHGERGVELGEAAADRHADDGSQQERGGDPDDVCRPVAQTLPEVLGGNGQDECHQSRRALPVRWRKTASRSGSTTSTPVTAAPDAVAPAKTRGSTWRASRTVSSMTPSPVETCSTPSTPARDVARASRLPSADNRTRSRP